MASSTEDRNGPDSEPETSVLETIMDVLPLVPRLVKTAVLHLLGKTRLSRYMDLRGELIMCALVYFFHGPSKSVTATQKRMNHDSPVKGKIWVSKYTTPAPPGSGVRDAIVRAIAGLQQPEMGDGWKTVEMPDAVPVEAEWQGYRAGATSRSPRPPLSESDMYKEMMKECSHPATVLYFHGGAHYLGDPSTHRRTTGWLAELTGGRCYSVRYRLAPQNPFPAGLTDALVSYLTLLYPPPGAFHEAVPAAHVVFSGDSAGANLSLALMQTILELRRQGSATVDWFGAEREVPLPAGVALSSLWADITFSMPSFVNQDTFDFLPPNPDDEDEDSDGKPRPRCRAWPASPPRASMYVADALLLHPLASVVLARDWRSAPPFYVCSGWEVLNDDARAVVAALHADGVPVEYEEYEAMPHVFSMLLSHLPSSRHCMERWAGFVRRVAERGDPDAAESRFVLVRARTLEEEELDPAKLMLLTHEQILERMQRRAKYMMARARRHAAKV